MLPIARCSLVSISIIGPETLSYRFCVKFEDRLCSSPTMTILFLPEMRTDKNGCDEFRMRLGLWGILGGFRFIVRVSGETTRQSKFAPSALLLPLWKRESETGTGNFEA